MLAVVIAVVVLILSRRETTDTNGKVTVTWMFPFTKAWAARVAEFEGDLFNKSSSSSLKYLYKFVHFMTNLFFKLHEVISALVVVLVLSLIGASYFGFGEYWYLPALVFFGVCFLAGYIKGKIANG